MNLTIKFYGAYIYGAITVPTEMNCTDLNSKCNCIYEILTAYTKRIKTGE